MAAAGRKRRKSSGVPERITKYFHPLGEPQGSNILDSEIQAKTTERETVDSDTASSVNDHDDLSPNESELAECHSHMSESESAGSNVMDLGRIIKPSMTNKFVMPLAS